MIEDLREVKKRRLALGWSQHQLAKLSGLSQSIITKLEAGKNIPRFDVVRKLDSALLLGEREGSVKAKDIMTTKLLAVKAHTPVGEAAKMLVEKGYSQAPVLKDGQIIGLVTERSLLMADAADSVEGHVEVSPPSVPPDTPIQILRQLLTAFPCALV